MVNNVLTTTASGGKVTTLGILTTTSTIIEDDSEVAGVIKIDEEFDQSLLDPTSDAYANKVAEILALVRIQGKPLVVLLLVFHSVIYSRKKINSNVMIPSVLLVCIKFDKHFINFEEDILFSIHELKSTSDPH